jgi:hypothetical protein
MENSRGWPGRVAAGIMAWGVAAGPAMVGAEEPAVTEVVEGEDGGEGFSERSPRARLSVEPGIVLPGSGDESLGLFGLNVDTHLGRWFHLGVGGFAASAGTRGGFFAGGVQGGVRLQLVGSLTAEASLLLGGGGGSNTPVGTGFLLRPAAGLHWDLRDWVPVLGGVSVGVAHMAFVNREANTTHLSVGVEVPWPTLSRPGESAEPVTLEGSEAYGASARSFRMTGHAYRLSASTAGADTESLGMLGFEYREWLARRVFAVIEPRATIAGGHAGFMELTLGGGVTLPIDQQERMHVFLTGGAGGAGGGGIRTGHGFFLRAAAGLEVDLPGATRLGLDAGLQGAPTGAFTAYSGGLRFGIVEQSVRARRHAVRELTSDDELVAAVWRGRLVNQTYFAAPLRHGDTTAINLVGVKFDHFLTDNLFVSGQGATSYTGISSAFSTGAFALGGRSAAMRRMRLFGEAMIGAAGGGQVDVGHGIYLQPMAGLQVELGEAYALEVSAGWKHAPTGTLSIPVAAIGLGYTFTTPRIRSR